MNKVGNLYRKIIPAVIVALMMTSLSGCGKGGKSYTNTNVVTDSSSGGTYTMTGVVTGNDTELRQVTVREIESDVDTILNYNATASILDKYGQEIDGDELEAGQIVEATYSTSDATVISMNVPDDVWEYQEVDDFKFDSEESSISFAGEKYKYTVQTYFSADNATIQMMELNNSDVLTVRGIGINAYSVVRTAGHGYLRLSNYNDFLGGTISVGNGIILPITDNMLITVPSGTYKVVLSNNGMSASKMATVKDNEEVALDFSDYVADAKNIATVTFDIDPYGADLYLNGTAVDYSKPVSLNYGTYAVTVKLTGYTTYSGTLEVADASPEVRISLTEEKATVSSATPDSDSSDDDDDDEEDDDSTTRKIDSKHTITISAPEGVEVYVDNVYKGLSPCKFTKIIGSQTITLSKNGYVTKSYSVDILDDDENVKLSFDELVEDAD